MLRTEKILVVLLVLVGLSCSPAGGAEQIKRESLSSWNDGPTKKSIIDFAYPVARRDQEWVQFVNTWIDLKRKDGTIDALYRHWILGEHAVEHRRRWSVIRNVLNWVE